MRARRTRLMIACLLGASVQLEAATGSQSIMGPSWVVVPGKAVGPIQIGMSQEQVRAAVAGDAGSPHGPLVKAFVARTPEGIGMGSTRAEVVKALGEPAADRRPPGGGEVLSYSGLDLMLVEGAVAQLTVWRAKYR